MKESFYKDINYIKNPHDLLVLVNKNNKLTSNFIPNNLVIINSTYANDNKLAREEAQTNFEKLSLSAKVLGYYIIAVSAFRDFEYQNELYNHYVETKGLEYADLASARPGHSEHQTGLAIDVMGSNKDYNKFDECIEFEWMKNNAHLYGFILRYPEGKEKITGFKYEPWHYRYVGKKVATDIYHKNLTLEEYLKNQS
ncbi:MAG: M15 family metallopeptidase [Bacilli bacterium]|nr:M15 family metallopeptidase [Bacilli bacterium]MDD4718684.1 M15 family metallopeptidase [Bacilli bacterium]